MGKHVPSKSEGKPRRKKKAAAEPRSRGIAPDAIGAVFCQRNDC